MPFQQIILSGQESSDEKVKSEDFNRLQKSLSRAIYDIDTEIASIKKTLELLVELSKKSS